MYKKLSFVDMFSGRVDSVDTLEIYVDFLCFFRHVPQPYLTYVPIIR